MRALDRQWPLEQISKGEARVVPERSVRAGAKFNDLFFGTASGISRNASRYLRSGVARQNNFVFKKSLDRISRHRGSHLSDRDILFAAGPVFRFLMQLKRNWKGLILSCGGLSSSVHFQKSPKSSLKNQCYVIRNSKGATVDLSQLHQPRNLNKSEIKNQLEKLVPYERKLMAVVIEHIAEVERRRLYLEWDFTSLYEYLTRGLGYSESAAYRRIQAARAMIQMPELKQELENGLLNLSQISLAQTAIKQEQKQNGEVSLEDKRDLFSEISKKTTQETRKILDETFELPIQAYPTERHRHDDSLDLHLNFKKDAKADLLRVREIFRI